MVKWYDRGLQNLWREFDSLIPCFVVYVRMLASLDFKGLAGIFVFLVFVVLKNFIKNLIILSKSLYCFLSSSNV